MEATANKAAVSYPGGLKEDQLKVVVAFLSDLDVLALLPTSYGKSLCFSCLPYAFEELEESSENVVVVVSPLTAIMKDQVFS